MEETKGGARLFRAVAHHGPSRARSFRLYRFLLSLIFVYVFLSCIAYFGSFHQQIERDTQRPCANTEAQGAITNCDAGLNFFETLAQWLSFIFPLGLLRPQAPTHCGATIELGAVASESRECTEIGRDILALGGNAVDALVGTTFCVGVIGMYHSGIGGGGFLLVRDRQGRYEAVDFRETAPAAAHQEMYRHKPALSVLGGLAVGIPGEVRGLEYVHKKYGDLPWKTVMQGAIKVARDGFRVSADLVRFMNAATTGVPNFLVDDPVWAVDFAPNGTRVELGDMMTRKRYASTLEKIANEGARAFYEGQLAEEMVTLVNQTFGIVTLEDLRDYQVTVKPPITINYRGYKLAGVASPAGGAVSLSILKTMEQYPLNDWADRDLSVHRFDEAMRFAYGARQSLGDPDFVDGVQALEEKMINQTKARDIRDRILDNSTQPVKAYDPDEVYTTESHGTSHIVTADRHGMATSLTTTINLLFGAQIMTPKSGIIMNNEMNDFSIPGIPNMFGFQPSEANYVRPGKRPLSSITPIMAEFPNGTLHVTVGAAGGSRIVSATAQVLWHVLEHGMTMAQALAVPRFHDQLMPNTVLVEYALDNGTTRSLMERGHNVTWVGPGLSSVQGVRLFGDGTFEAASEPRQQNSAGLIAHR